MFQVVAVEDVLAAVGTKAGDHPHLVTSVEVHEVDDDVEALDRRDGQATMGHRASEQPAVAADLDERRALRRRP